MNGSGERPEPKKENQEKRTKKPQSSKPSEAVKFKPPTPEEVSAYCSERKNSIDAEAFCDYYVAQGWKLANGRPMQDWQASVRTWERRDRKPSGNGRPEENPHVFKASD